MPEAMTLHTTRMRPCLQVNTPLIDNLQPAMTALERTVPHKDMQTSIDGHLISVLQF